MKSVKQDLIKSFIELILEQNLIFQIYCKLSETLALRPEHLFNFWCLDTPFFELNLAPQYWHSKYLMSLWTDSLCFVSLLISLKAELHWSQGYGLSYKSHRSWSLYWTKQENIPTPVWSIRCLLNCTFHLNTLPQVSHLNCVASPWTFLWSNMLHFVVKSLPQRSQTQGFSPVCINLCASNWVLAT